MTTAGTSREPLNRPAAARDAWRSVLADAVCDPAELCRLLGLPAGLADEAAQAAGQFPMRVPRSYLGRIRPGDPLDPLLAQILPRKEELAEVPQFVADPLGEAATACAPGLLRKYKRRLLIVASGTCGVHCRFCFRRHFPYKKTAASQDWNRTLAQIAADSSIDEVVLSGGDPLATPDAQLAQLAARLAKIPHLQRLRVHTRLPIVIPERVTDELLQWLRGTRLTPLVVVHANHPGEIDAAVAAALGRLVDAGVAVLNQAVLLRGVNDSVDVLAELFLRLVNLRVMPYYLHQLDRVAGAAHFEVPEAVGRELIRQLRERLPGYAVPRYVRDEVGGRCKRVIE
jgi:EF-P beta-lysylation protein EpmB